MPVELGYHEWTWLNAGYNLVKFPVMREGIETVADLYQEYALFNALAGHHLCGDRVLDAGFRSHTMDQDPQVAGQVLLDNSIFGTVVMVTLDWTADIGDAVVIEQIGDGELELIPGLNVV